MDDWTPVLVLLLEELMRGEYGTVAIPREYLKLGEGREVKAEWQGDHVHLTVVAKEPAVNE
jgi:hypothetical protein